jgi:hypothetical protein
MFMEKGMKINYLAFRLDRGKNSSGHGWEKQAYIMISSAGV